MKNSPTIESSNTRKIIKRNVSSSSRENWKSSCSLIAWQPKKTPNAFFRLAICRCGCMSKYGWKFGLKQHTHNREMIFLGEKHRERLRRNHNIEKELSWRRSRCGAKKPPSTTCEQYKETFSACACGRATTTTMEWGREIFHSLNACSIVATLVSLTTTFFLIPKEIFA